MGWSITVPLESLPPRRAVTRLDEIFGVLVVGLHIFTLVTPFTPRWILIRRSVALPVITTCYLWLLWVPKYPHAEDQWGVACLLVAWIMRLIDHVSFIPELHHYRLRPVHSSTCSENGTKEMVKETVPPAWTLQKFYWAFSLVASWRGIGWSYSAPLSKKALSHPYTPSSSRLSFLAHQLPTSLLIWLVGLFSKRYMLTAGHTFFSGQKGWADLSRMEVVWCSLAVVARVWWILNVAYVPVACGCVIVGGLLGWKGEFWEPWGWPPIFGGLKEIWQYPGLSTIWSRSWNNGGRRWFYAIGWVGIGEKILRLPKSGVSSHKLTHPPSTTISTSTGTKQANPKIIVTDSNGESRSSSRELTPSHPIPSNPTSKSSRNLTLRIAISNLIKSTIAFTLSGLLHDISYPLLYLNNHPHVKSLTISYESLIFTTPFFSIQPLALAIEAIIKRTYRGWKLNRGIKRGEEPAWLILVERTVSFLWVWTWLFWCAAWYVSGVGRMGVYHWPKAEDRVRDK